MKIQISREEAKQLKSKGLCANTNFPHMHDHIRKGSNFCNACVKYSQDNHQKTRPASLIVRKLERQGELPDSFKQVLNAYYEAIEAVLGVNSAE